MSNMMDRIRANGVRTFSDSYAQHARDMVMVGANDNVPIIRVDNVAHYWAEQMDGQLLDTTDMPNIAPPFPAFFVEYRWPKIEFPNTSPCSMLQHSDYFANPHGIGALVITCDTRTSGGKAILDLELDALPQVRGEAEELDLESIVRANQDEIRWIIHAYPLLETYKGNIIGPLADVAIYVKEDGSMLEVHKGRSGMSFHIFSNSKIPDEQTWMFACSMCMAMIDPMMLAVSFMHCKNVSMNEQSPPEKVAKKYLKKHGFPMTKHYTLEIDPMRKVLRTEGGSDSQGLSRALHICRGHFKHFGGENKKLFGKYEGTYWWGSQVRGNQSRGEVSKEYSVKDMADTKTKAIR